MLATDTAIKIAEMDKAVNLTIAIETSVPSVAVAYLAQDNRKFWITAESMLMEWVDDDKRPVSHRVFNRILLEHNL